MSGLLLLVPVTKEKQYRESAHLNAFTPIIGPYLRQDKVLKRNQSARFDLTSNSGIKLVSGQFQIKVRLQIQPPPRTSTEITGKAQRGVGRDSALTAHNLAHTDRRNPKCLGKRVLGQTQWLHEIMEQNFTRMNWRKLFCLHKFQ